jgi:hypothetical protein
VDRVNSTFGRASAWSLSKVDKIQQLLGHIAKVICSADKVKWGYLMSWLAWTVQNPGRHPGVAIVLRSSAEGAGRSLLGELMVRIFGRHGLTVSDNCRLLENHDEHLEFACFVLIKEALFAGDARVADKIKSRLTSNMVTINPKFRPARSVPNRMAAMLCTNHEWAVPAGAGARRWFIVDVSEARTGDKAYFDALHADLESGGDGQFLNFLLNIPLGDWHPRAVSRTMELALQTGEPQAGLSMALGMREQRAHPQGQPLAWPLPRSRRGCRNLNNARRLQRLGSRSRRQNRK